MGDEFGAWNSVGEFGTLFEAEADDEADDDDDDELGAFTDVGDAAGDV